MARLKFRALPWEYRSGRSCLHRLPAGLKLILLLVISIGCFSLGPPALAAAALAVSAGAAAAGRRPWELLRGSRSLAALLIFTGIIRTVQFPAQAGTESPPAGELLGGLFTGQTPPGVFFSGAGFAESLRFAGGILVSFAAGGLLFSVTTMAEIRNSLGRGEAAVLKPLIVMLKKINKPPALRLARRLERPRLSLGIALMLGFLPRFFLIWENAGLAYKARMGKRGPAKLRLLIPLAVEEMIEAAAETAAALEARGLEL
jgi:energy-coupling factor transporter transmembrane protein EcfT